MLAKLLFALRWGYIAVSEVVGWAGIPGDFKVWTDEWLPMIGLDDWTFRALLVLSGIAVLSSNQWWPQVKNHFISRARRKQTQAVRKGRKRAETPLRTWPAVLVPIRYGVEGQELAAHRMRVGQLRAFEFHNPSSTERRTYSCMIEVPVDYRVIFAGGGAPKGLYWAITETDTHRRYKSLDLETFEQCESWTQLLQLEHQRCGSNADASYR